MSDLDVLTSKSLGGLKVQRVDKTANWINMLLYGDPGVGKTVLAGSAEAVEEMGPVLFIDVEGGTYSLRDKYPDVDVVRVQHWNDMQRVYSDLYDGQTGYRTVVLDTLTEIQKFSMSEIMKELLQKEPGRDPDVPGMREWGKNIEQVRRTVRAFRDLPMNAILTAHAIHDRDTKTGKTMTRPSLSGKLSNEVAGFMDIVLYMYVKVVDGELQRICLTGSTDTEVAKDRSDKLPTPVLANPTMKQIYNLIQGADIET